MMRPTSHGKYSSSSLNVLLCVIFIAFIACADANAAEWDRDGAHQSFLKAEKMYQGLIVDPDGSSLEEYLRCVRTFREVYFKDPHYAHASRAIYLEGLLYQKMGDLLEQNTYYKLAIKRFKFLVSDYNSSSYCKDALLRTGEIYSLKLGDANSAQETYALLQSRYGPSAVQAVIPAPVSDSPAVSESSRNFTTESLLAKKPSIVNNIHHSISKDYTRLVIDLDSEADYKKHVLQDPKRIYFDIKNATLSDKLLGSVFTIQDEFLKRVRVGQNTPDTVRIVLDFSEFGTYSISELQDPYRIVIELHHPPPEQDNTTEPSFARTESGEKILPPETGESMDPGIIDDAMTVDETNQNTTPKTAETSLFEGKTVPLADLLHRDQPDPPKTAEPTSKGQRTLMRVLGLKIGKIVIDPGHGGHDLGTMGPGGTLEKDLVLALAFKLRDLIDQKLGAEVILTRDKDIFVSLEERTRIANENHADLFISIHANSSRYNSISGVETYYLDFAKSESERIVAARENAGTGSSVSDLEDLVAQIAQADKSTESKEFATIIQQELFRRAQTVFSSTKDRGVRSAPFIVLIGAKMPSILTEVAFISNPKDEKKLNEEDSLNQLAEALFSGIDAYVKKLGNYPIAYGTVPNK